MAKKYHIEFGAAKCKVVKIGKGPKSNIILNNQVLEEVETYKYLGEVFNNKGNMEAHIKAIEGKIHAATHDILTETGNKEFRAWKCKQSGKWWKQPLYQYWPTEQKDGHLHKKKNDRYNPHSTNH